MQFNPSRIVLGNWSRKERIYVPEDIIKMLVKYRGSGEMLAVDKSGAFFMAEFREIDPNKAVNADLVRRQNSTNKFHNKTVSDKGRFDRTHLTWAESDKIGVQLSTKPTNFTLCLTPDNSMLYKIGGLYPELKTVLYHDFTRGGLDNQWKNLSNSGMIHARASAAAVCLDNDHLIAIGGNNTTLPRHRSVEEWSAITEEWTQLNACKYQRKESPCVRLDNNKCLLIGGNLSHGCEIFDRSANHWTEVKKIVYSNANCGAVLWQDQVYVAGGHSNKKNCKYLTERDRWEALPDTNMIHNHACVSLCYIQGAVFCHGRNASSAEILDERIGKWIVLVDDGMTHHPMKQTNLNFQGQMIGLNS